VKVGRLAAAGSHVAQRGARHRRHFLQPAAVDVAAIISHHFEAFALPLQLIASNRETPS
jgi:hypothetical protein